MRGPVCASQHTPTIPIGTHVDSLPAGIGDAKPWICRRSELRSRPRSIRRCREVRIASRVLRIDRVLRQRKSVDLPVFASSDGVHKTSMAVLVLRPEPVLWRPEPLSKGGRRVTRSACALLEGSIGGNNDQVDRRSLRHGCRNICSGHVTRTGSSAGQHDHASPASMRCRYAHDQRQMRDYTRPPPGPPRGHPPLLKVQETRSCIGILKTRHDLRLGVG